MKKFIRVSRNMLSEISDIVIYTGIIGLLVFGICFLFSVFGWWILVGAVVIFAVRR